MDIYDVNHNEASRTEYLLSQSWPQPPQNKNSVEFNGD